jgi:hypothetical protein
MLQDMRTEMQQKLQSQGLELQESKMYMDAILNVLSMGTYGNGGTTVEDYDGSDKSYRRTTTIK